MEQPRHETRKSAFRAESRRLSLQPNTGGPKAVAGDSSNPSQYAESAHGGPWGGFLSRISGKKPGTHGYDITSLYDVSVGVRWRSVGDQGCRSSTTSTLTELQTSWRRCNSPLTNPMVRDTKWPYTMSSGGISQKSTTFHSDGRERVSLKRFAPHNQLYWD